MFNRYKIINNEKEDCLYLYVDQFFEFSKEFDKPVETRHQDIYDKIYNFLGANNIRFNGNKVFLVINGVIVSTLLLKDYDNQPKYIEYVKDFTNFTVPDTENTTNMELLPIEKIDQIIVNINKSNTLEKYTLDAYIVGALASIMPFYFRTEALKAGAIIIRTNTLNATYKGEKINNNNFLTPSELKKMWKDEFPKKYNKYKEAVLDTKEEYLTYNNFYIDAVYHTTNNGMTEDGKLAYLPSVTSKWDLDSTDFLKYQNISLKEFNDKFKTNITTNSQIRILETSPSNRIKQIEIDGKLFSGKEVKEKLHLRSTDFDLIITGTNVLTTTRGNGNGIGFSLNGANGMAKHGHNYQQILKHYYPNTIIKNVLEK